jgi:hypothetical protein
MHHDAKHSHSLGTDRDVTHVLRPIFFGAQSLPVQDYLPKAAQPPEQKGSAQTAGQTPK